MSAYNKLLLTVLLASAICFTGCRSTGKPPVFGTNPLHVKITPAILEKNPCYTANRKIEVKGLMLHSVGCPQPSASVFVKNWNSEKYNRACVHGFIDAHTGEVFQTLPWDHFGWHAGSGKKGSVNKSHIGVEMCEPDSLHYVGGATFECNDPENAKIMAQRTYDAAVNLFAYLCWKYKLDPLEDGVIISHNEGRLRQIAFAHVDPEHLWNQLKMSLTMDSFRQDVKKQLDAYMEFRNSKWRQFKNKWWDVKILRRESGPLE